MNNTSSSQGIATLPTVILLGIMTLAVAVAVATVSLSELYISQGNMQSTKALLYAEAGVRDALLQIARNKNYVCATTDCYAIDFSTNGCATGNDCATVVVSAGTGTIASPKIITAKGIAQTSSRILQVSVVLDGGTATDGGISSVTWNEI